MPKYVAKEDVEKGLVDPTKSLEEQPEYKKKVQQAVQVKEKAFEQKTAYQRPHKERPPRNERPKFNWNKHNVTVDTKVPEQPSHLLPEPDAQKHKQGFQDLKAQREVIKAERGAILDEQRAIIRDVNESQKSGKAVITQYSGVMKEKMAAENQLRKDIRVVDDEKKRINVEIEILKSKADQLRRPARKEGYSLEQLKERIVEKEHDLTTNSKIGKKEEAKLSNEINDLKRAIATAKPLIEIQSQASKIQDQITLLLQELKPIKQELSIKITEANSIKAELDQLKEQRKNEQGNIQERRSIEDIKAEYTNKIKAVEAKRDNLEETVDDYLDLHTREKDQYEDQQDLLRYIDWVEAELVYARKRKEEDDVRKKEKEERDRKRKKEEEDYEKRKEERQKREEERLAREEERKKKLEEERVRFINRNPNYEIIDRCQALVDYCGSLKPSASLKYEDPRSKEPGELKFGKEWTKEIKGGAQVVMSKKFNKDDEVKKPAKQPKKKEEEKPEDEDFSHSIDVVNQFQAIQLLPPKNLAELDSTVKTIKDKISFYSNPTEQEKTAFREKATKQFQERCDPREAKKHGTYKEKREEGREAGREAGEAEGPSKQKKPQRRQKKEISERDFPEIA